jgi:lipopolysaccharide/colanic/teichoic acid biosynthesis glycosyltransferase
MNYTPNERIEPRHWQPIQRRIKYALDRVLAAVMLILCCPAIAVIAVGIKLQDHGPIFFRQKRLGLHGRHFNILKFRTMIVDADRFVDSQGSVAGIDRITPWGRILRQFSLDELPQLVNILCGQMSTVGPRPMLPERLAQLNREQRRRLLVKPGLTGLAQVNGRNTLKWSKRVQLDVEYVDRLSLWLDFKIVARTVAIVMSREGIVLDRNPEDVDDLGRPECAIRTEESTANAA